MLASFITSLHSGWSVTINALSRWGHDIDTQVGPIQVAALIVLTVAAVTWAVTNVVRGGERELDDALKPYRVRHRASAPGEEDERFAVPLLRLATSWLVAFAEWRGFRESLAERIERAGVPIGVGEFLAISLVGAVIVLAIATFVAGVIGFVLGLVFSLVVPIAVLQALADRRARQFATQIPDVLKLLAASLRAGFSLLQGLDAILYQVKDPMATELRRAFAATRVGTPIEDALQDAAERVRSRDFSWTVTAIRIQREVGGNLAEILETVASTMNAREAIRREVRTLTAEGRLSAMIVGALPFALAALIFVVNRGYIDTLFTTFGGQVALLLGFLLEMAGIYWLYRIVQIEI